MLWVILPLLTHKFIWCQAFQRFEPLRQVVGHHTHQIQPVLAGRDMGGVCDPFSYGSDFSDYRPLASIRYKLALYLAALGWQASEVRFVVGGAMTPMGVNTSRQYRLFRVWDEALFTGSVHS
jgi:hypothetical protein